MYLKDFSLQGIRNLIPVEIELAPQLNIFYGDNAAGKSSILEAIGLLTTGRSFRAARMEIALANDAENFTLFGRSECGHRMGLGYNKPLKKKSIKLNGESVNLLSELARCFPTQIISPESYLLIDSGPSERRKYLDWCLFHVEHSYHKAWKNYYATLKQRNALLKKKSAVTDKELDVWDEQLCLCAEKLTLYRQSTVLKLMEALSGLLETLGIEFNGTVSLQYYPGYSGEFAEKLKESRHHDIHSGFTRAGPHNADVRIKVDSEPAKEFLSRGQKKVLINALYLAQTLLLKKVSANGSLFIIDDLTSELDEQNQKALLQTLLSQKNVQIIVSCLQLDTLKWLKTGYNSAHMFHVEHGKIMSKMPGI